MNSDDKRILLHSCCAVCASSCIERLESEGWKVVLFYDNPNISPESEREKRLDYVRRLAAVYNVELIVGNTPHSVWQEVIRGFEAEPEGAERCKRCFDLNLHLARAAADSEDIGCFCTSLTVSRYKNSKNIIAIGSAIEGYAPYDFKKKGGEERSIRIARKLELYRQKYCGCEYSVKTSSELENDCSYK